MLCVCVMMHLCVWVKRRSQTSSPPSSPLASSGFSDHCYERDCEREEEEEIINKTVLSVGPYCDVCKAGHQPEGDGGVVAGGTRGIGALQLTGI